MLPVMSCFAVCKKVVEENLNEDKLELKLIQLIENRFLPMVETMIKDKLESRKEELQVEIDLQDK